MKNSIKILSLFFLALISSCSTESEIENEELQINQKSSFNVESTYQDIITNKKGAIDTYEALSVDQKQNLWAYKYDRFIANNDLTPDQLSTIELLINHVTVLDFDDSEAGNSNESLALDEKITDVFDFETSKFLLYNLANGSDDLVTNGCFWCFEEIERTPCIPEMVDGQFTGDFTMTVTTRVRRFWIGWKNKVFNNVPCDPLTD